MKDVLFVYEFENFKVIISKTAPEWLVNEFTKAIKKRLNQE